MVADKGGHAAAAGLIASISKVVLAQIIRKSDNFRIHSASFNLTART